MKKRLFSWWHGALIALLVALVWFVPVSSSALHAVVGWVSWPWQRTGILLAGQGAWVFASKAELAKRNLALEAQVRDIARAAAKWQAAAEELPQLQALLAPSPELGIPTTPARVLLFFEEGAEQFLLIDKGTRAHIAPGRVVIAQGGAFVGVVARADLFTAHVRLLTSPSIRVGILPLGAPQTVAVARGMGFDRLLAEFIPRTIEVNTSTLFLTSGTDAGVPSGLLVGAVEEVIDEPGMPHKQARLKPLADIRALKWVGVYTEFATETPTP